MSWLVRGDALAESVELQESRVRNTALVHETMLSTACMLLMACGNSRSSQVGRGRSSECNEAHRLNIVHRRGP